MSAVTSLAAFALVIVFFAPRFEHWPWLDLDPAEHHPPEFNRAIDTLRQLDNPFVAITNPTNRVINWRLLFPILGHYLHLPRLVFLGFPTAGCLIVLGYVAHLVLRESGTWRSALAASALTGTTSWFFVSTGWLGYFDSWYVLGLLVTAFGRSNIVSGLACLLAPWVDERFVLALPLVVVVKGSAARGSEGGSFMRFLSDGLRFFALVSPYCAIRLVVLAAGIDKGSAAHLLAGLASARTTWQVADGLWSGLRALWVFVVMAPAVLTVQHRLARAGLLVVATVATIAVNIPIADDISRSASTILPAAALGIVLSVRERTSLVEWLIATALAFNLITPARHVVAGWNKDIPVSPLHIEFDRLSHPSRQVAGLHLRRAARFAKANQLRKSLSEVETAIQIDPLSAGAQLNRGTLLYDLGRPMEAAPCFDIAILLAPGVPDSYRERARFRRAIGQLEPACQDLRFALDLTPATSPRRAAMERELAEVRSAMGTP
jgi:hypothetical protein